MTFLSFLIPCLAVWRLSLLASSEIGPWRMFQKWRASLKRKAKSNEVVRKSAIHQGMECFLCNATWYAAPVAAFCLYRSSLPWWVVAFGDWFLLWQAICGLAIIFKFAFAKGF